MQDYLAKNGSMEETMDFLKDLYEELKKRGNKNNSYTITDDEGNPLLEVGLKVIEDFLSRCYNYHYYTDEEIEELRKKILDGDLPESIEEKRIIGISKSDFLDVCKNYESIDESEEEKRKKLLQCAISIAEYLLRQKSLTFEELIDLYMNKLIPLDIIKQLKMDSLSKESIDKRFKDLYDEYIYSDDEEGKTRSKMGRYSSLYGVLSEKEIVNVDKLIEDLTNSYGKDKRAGILDDLESFGLISLEKCVEYEGINYIIYQYQNGKFLPEKIKELYTKGIFTLDDIVLFIGTIDETIKKYTAIGAIFPGENEEDVLDRDLLVAECLKIEDSIKTKTGKKRSKKIVDNVTRSGKVSDPFARLSVFRELDSIYDIEMTLDGHVIVTYPQLGKVIIEKLFDTKGEPYYGAATYILDIDYYNANKSDIVIKDKVVWQALTKNMDAIGVTRIEHDDVDWGEDLKEEFGVDVPGRYSEEAIKRINEGVARVDRSKKKR